MGSCCGKKKKTVTKTSPLPPITDTDTAVETQASTEPENASSPTLPSPPTNINETPQGNQIQGSVAIEAETEQQAIEPSDNDNDNAQSEPDTNRTAHSQTLSENTPKLSKPKFTKTQKKKLRKSRSGRRRKKSHKRNDQKLDVNERKQQMDKGTRTNIRPLMLTKSPSTQGHLPAAYHFRIPNTNNNDNDYPKDEAPTQRTDHEMAEAIQSLRAAVDANTINTSTKKLSQNRLPENDDRRSKRSMVSFRFQRCIVQAPSGPPDDDTLCEVHGMPMPEISC